MGNELTAEELQQAKQEAARVQQLLVTYRSTVDALASSTRELSSIFMELADNYDRWAGLNEAKLSAAKLERLTELLVRRVRTQSTMNTDLTHSVASFTTEFVGLLNAEH